MIWKAKQLHKFISILATLHRHVTLGPVAGWLVGYNLLNEITRCCTDNTLLIKYLLWFNCPCLWTFSFFILTFPIVHCNIIIHRTILWGYLSSTTGFAHIRSVMLHVCTINSVQRGFGNQRTCLLVLVSYFYRIRTTVTVVFGRSISQFKTKLAYFEKW